MSLGDVVYDIKTKKFFVPNTGAAVQMAVVDSSSGEGGNTE